jgi:pimeloyl-ACP methyl ester carboxylesterase
MLNRLLNSLILLPDPYNYQSPEDLGLHAEAFTFHNAQGGHLSGWFFRLQPEALCTGPFPDEAPVVLFCPGTSGNLSSHLYYIELLCRAGFAVFGFDYTGFGRSTGKASLQSLLTDTLSAADFLRHTQGIKRFGIFGISIGANVALLAAALRPDVVGGVAVEGVAIQREVVRGILKDGIMGPRYIDAIRYEGQPPIRRESHVLNRVRLSGWLADALAYMGVSTLPFQAKDPLQVIKDLADTPVFLIHGVEDPLLPCEATLQAYAVKPGARHLWLIPEVSHAQEPLLAQDAEYSAQLSAFFHAALHRTCRWSPQMPPIAFKIHAQETGTLTLQLDNPGPPGLVLTTVVGERTVDFRTVWVQRQTHVTYRANSAHPLVSSMRLYEVAGSDGQTARVRFTARGTLYRSLYRSHVRALSRSLHEGRLQDLDSLVQALPCTRPEAPFDFFLGLYCVQIMQRTRYKYPHIARAAAETFTHYWHYGSQDASHHTPSLWDLAADVLNKPVGPRRHVASGQ